MGKYPVVVGIVEKNVAYSPFHNMHHNEIGQMIEVFEDFFLATDSQTPITVIPIVPSKERGINAYGIELVARWQESHLVVQVNGDNKDSQQAKMHFYLNSGDKEPSLSVQYAPGEFEEKSIRFFIKTAIQASKGRIDLLKIKRDDFLYQTNLRWLEK